MAVFIYALLTFALMRFVLIDYISPVSRGGVLAGDPVYYEKLASDLAAKIKEEGWHVWTLRSEGQGVAGVTAALYVVFGLNWLPVIILNAAMHALASVALVTILRQFFGAQASLIGVIPFILSPYQMQWFSQINKDSYNVLGVFLICVAAVHVFRRERIFIAASSMVAGLLLVWLNRPYAIYLITGAILVSSSLAIALLWFSRRYSVCRSRARQTYGILGLVCLTVMAAMLVRSVESRTTATGSSNTIIITNDACKRSEAWDFISRYTTPLETALCTIVAQRRMFETLRNDPNATTRLMTPDLDVKLSGSLDVLLYAPRALQLGFFAPFPADWGVFFVNTLSPFRNVVGCQMLLAYIGMAMVSYRLLLRADPPAVLMLGMCACVIAVLGLTIAHIGTLHRYRYPYLALITAFGLAQLWDVFRARLLVFRRRHGKEEARQAGTP